MPSRWVRKLARVGADVHVLELEGGGWRVMVFPAGMCPEPLYRPPYGFGVALAREDAFKVALAEYGAAVSGFIARSGISAWKELFSWGPFDNPVPPTPLL